MTLGQLFPGSFPADEASRPVAGVALDSRKVQPGYAFVAVPGSKLDGMSFVPEALARGAVAIVAERQRPADLPADVAFGQVKDARRALAVAAARLNPRQPRTVVAVTGTAGKSSVADFVRQIFTACGRQAASLGTIGVIAPSGAVYGSLTTPDPITLHELLAKLAGEGVTHLAMEASSHGLEQRRLDGVRLSAAGFTNLGRDHLDYHPSLDAYFEAKLRLFNELLPSTGVAVVNVDSGHGEEVLVAAAARGLDTLSVGEGGEDMQITEIKPDGFAQRLRVKIGGAEYKVRLPLVGQFQAANALVAAGLCIATGEEAAPVMAALEGLTGVPGRMERVAEVNGGLVIVDYAHKPDALREVLTALRPYASGRLVCVVGAGGDRDPGKRPLMGKAAIEGADAVIVTDDNPRSEDPAAIRAAILEGAPSAREIGDRGEAIRTAVRGLNRGDVLVVAGKGHETGQIVGSTTLPFSDHEAVRAAVSEMTT
ncbi:UDP-N-acetylmuramoyl-L-alanyl-D-glutamate--2,6-diaminopimelate ligase [Chelatococcus reniformis]|uniref:UDP-N-acetylmuramoyl-L-alanyl-D-glutamate--2,6-diaminopimelate ligase n=1 Tax=Chelatococcus reniformis TaxID=1494448 RepID=A0A916UBB7_9HYPH|nr:UDP-N-acetylmuramoyl-L-alanyl-D-glutamate--2,6-diaminopimelate ligase [Chelatococcus reniformis]GGC67190.1 UDP-N-acetylmuramoyl-L-alanyl-D-glutamate--2,6-diaminopimelate ligase [Chelatococcus reniformis]